jgi:hypothetical protein
MILMGAKVFYKMIIPVIASSSAKAGGAAKPSLALMELP